MDKDDHDEIISEVTVRAVYDFSEPLIGLVQPRLAGNLYALTASALYAALPMVNSSSDTNASVLSSIADMTLLGLSNDPVLVTGGSTGRFVDTLFLVHKGMLHEVKIDLAPPYTVTTVSTELPDVFTSSPVGHIELFSSEVEFLLVYILAEPRELYTLDFTTGNTTQVSVDFPVTNASMPAKEGPQLAGLAGGTKFYFEDRGSFVTLMTRDDWTTANSLNPYTFGMDNSLVAGNLEYQL